GLKPRDVALSDFDLAPVVQETVAREAGERPVAIELAPDLRVRAEPTLLARAVGNLVRNAIRYGGPGRIAVTATRAGDRVIVAVEDEGPGVPATALDRLGEPFFRPETARTRETGGVGLGLSIVR